MILQRVGMLFLWIACVLVDLISLTHMLLCIVVGSKRAMHIAYAKDQVANTVIGGHWDEKISSRAWREQDTKRRWYYGRILIDLLFFFDKAHSRKSFENEMLEAEAYKLKYYLVRLKDHNDEKAANRDFLT